MSTGEMLAQEAGSKLVAESYLDLEPLMHQLLVVSTKDVETDDKLTINKITHNVFNDDCENLLLSSTQKWENK